MGYLSQAWWDMPVIPLRRQRQKDHKFKNNLGCTGRFYLKTPQFKKKEYKLFYGRGKKKNNDKKKTKPYKYHENNT